MDYDYDELMCISAELLAEQAAAGELSDDTLRRIASAPPNATRIGDVLTAAEVDAIWHETAVLQ